MAEHSAGVPIADPLAGVALAASVHLRGDVQQRGGQAQRCDRQRESAGRHAHGKTDQRWDDRATERGAWNPIMRSAAAAEVCSAAVRTSSGCIGAVENPNSSTAVVAVLGDAGWECPSSPSSPVSPFRRCME
jgi:hypothetical protein